MAVEPIAARNSSKTSVALLRVKAIKTTATQMSKMVKKIEIYFILAVIMPHLFKLSHSQTLNHVHFKPNSPA